MRVFLLILLYVGLCNFVIAEGEDEMKRGTFPFMAFIFFPDETVVNAKGARFSSAAVLIRNDWLISSSLENGETALAFPNKTLLARLGAISVDDHFNLNEDEGEQEREVIIIVRPYNFSRTEWWQDDISLLKTLLPFNMTTSVSPIIQNQLSKRDISEQTCFILIYAKRYGNATDRILMQMPVELLPPTQENCGINFRTETMICANDSNDKNKDINVDFCEGNGGGPLMCDNEVTGVQTYINDCRQPHLYQMLTTRQNLITCATNEKYEESSCSHICSVIRKDPPDGSTSEVTVTKSITDDKLSDTDLSTTSNASLGKESTSESEISKSTITEINTIQVINKTSILTTTYSHDTTLTASSEVYANTDEDIFDPTEERDRKANVEAHHQIVRSEASMNTRAVFCSLFLGLTLICLT